MSFALILLMACGSSDSGSAPDAPAPEPTVSAAPLFDENEFNDVRLTMASEDWQSIVEDTRGDEWRPATFEWKDTRLENVGVRPSGDFSRFSGNPKQSVRLQFNAFADAQRFLGLRSLKLDGCWVDLSFLRERLGYGLHRGRIPAPRAVHGRLFVNEEYRGVYLIEERVDSVFVLDRFGGTLGNLYKLYSNATDQYLWTGDDPGRYVPRPWDPTTHETTGDPSVVVRFVDVLTNDPSKIAEACDLETLLRYFAVEAFINNTDGLAGRYGGGNHYQYYRFEDGLFRVIPWDLTSTWGSEPARNLFDGFDQHRLTDILKTREDLRAAYKARVAELVDEFGDDQLHARIDAMYEQIRDAVYADPNKRGSDSEFDAGPAYLKKVISERTASLRSQLEQP